MKNEDCTSCMIAVCSDECFNRHPGSIIALVKVLKNIEKTVGIKIHLIK